MPVVEEYWNGVLRRLQAEVDGFNRLVGHHGERGRENEMALARMLQPLVPARYAVGTGLLIDSYDASSKQCDVVLFDQADQPRLLAQTSQLLHPVETVKAVVEVKTTLDSTEIEDAAAKKASIDALRAATIGEQRSLHPLFLLFAYAADTTPKTVAARLLALPPEQRPDLVCLMTPGLVAGHGHLLEAPDSSDGGNYIVGATYLLNEQGDPVRHPVTGRYAEHLGGTYPIVPHEGTGVLGHPARALLLFTDGLLRGLAELDGSAPPVSSAYVSAAARRLAALQVEQNKQSPSA